MSFVQSDAYDTLRSDGFTDGEIVQMSQSRDKLGNPININIDSFAYRKMRSERKQWVDMVKGYGWDSEQIQNELNRYYNRDSRRSIFDFLKAEYRPSGQRADYWNRVREEKVTIINSELEGYHGTDVHTTGVGGEAERLTKEQEEMIEDFGIEPFEESPDEETRTNIEEERINPDEIQFRDERGKYIPKKNRPVEDDSAWFPSDEEIEESTDEDLT